MAIRLSQIRQEILTEYQIDVSYDRIRRYEKEGLFSFDREKESNFRVTEKNKVSEIKNIILLIELGTPISYLTGKNNIALARRINAMKDITKTLTVPKWK